MRALVGQFLAIALLLAAYPDAATDGRDRPPRLTGGVHEYVVQSGDSFTSIGARFGAEPVAIADDNHVPVGARLRIGQRLLVDGRHLLPAHLPDGILINLPQRMLFVSRQNRLLHAFPVAAGRADWASPAGDFTVTVKEIDPTWDVPTSIQREQAREGRPVMTRVLPGPANPLGDRWIGLSAPAIGIHGTNQPSSVYRFTTHGCFRLHPEDARVLFDAVSVGAPVRILYEPVLAAVDDSGRVWLEVHRDAYRRTGSLEGLAQAAIAEAGAPERIDIDALRRCVRERRGRPCIVG